MKRYIFLLIFLFALTSSYAQIPKNNLGKTKSELLAKFPNLSYISTRDTYTEYESDGIDFTFKNGKVVSESMTLDEGRNFGSDWFVSMFNAFKKTSYERIAGPTDNGMSVYAMFYYPGFWITLTYWYDDGVASIIYQSPNYFN